MAGLLEEFGVNLDDVPTDPSAVESGWWDFQVADLYVLKGTKNKPDNSWVIIQYSLGDDGQAKDEWFGMPLDQSSPTPNEVKIQSMLKRRLMDLGLDEASVAAFEAEDVIGARGRLEVYDNKGYQNIKNVQLAEAEGAPAPEAEDEKPAATRPARAAAATAKGAVDNPFPTGRRRG